MLRITVHDKPESLTFQLEGGLAGPWVQEAEECRQRKLAGRRQLAICFDLAGLTFIDDAGKAYLAAMYRLGAEFVAADCLTKAIVAEITRGQESGIGVQRSEVRSQRSHEIQDIEPYS
jgi:hypothetical protein